MRIVQLEQKSQPWLRWRSEGIGGSDVASIMGISPYATREELMLEKLGKARREETYAMRRGDRFEPAARRKAELRLGFSLQPICVEHDDLPWVRASLDGVNLARQVGIEAKAPNKVVHEMALDRKLLTPYYQVQCQYQMFVTGWERIYYCSLSENDIFSESEKFVMLEVEEDAEQQATILEACEAFWNELQALIKENQYAAR